MKVDGKEAHLRTQGILTIVAWAGHIAMKQHPTPEEAARFKVGDVASDALEADGFILSSLAVS